MKIKNNNLIKNITYNLISITILMNAFQMVLSWNFNIRINMWIEYAVIAFLFIINKFRIANIRNIIIMVITAVILAINSVINPSTTLKFYINEFLLFALPLMLIFLIKIDLKKFTKTFFYYNIINAILYLFVPILNPDVLISEYMTFGFYAIFSLSYVIIYAYYNKHKKILVAATIVLPLVFINGNRGTILVATVTIILMILMNVKDSKKKILLIAIVVMIAINISTILRVVLDFAVENMDIENSYSIRNLYNMLESEDFASLIGGRYDIFEQAINEFKQHPILGIGVATFQEKYGYFPHNIIIDVLSTFGIILGTAYFCYIILTGIKLYNMSKNNLEIRILFIFMIANMMKLMLSKTFIYDPAIWLYISVSSYILEYKKYLKKGQIND